MKVATVQKTLAAVAVSLILLLAGFTVDLAHGTAPGGLLLTTQLRQVFPGGHAQLDSHTKRFGLASVLCALPAPSQSPIRATWTSVAHYAIPIQTHLITPTQARTAIWRLFDTVLLI